MSSVIDAGMSGICSQIQFADLTCIKNSDLGPHMKYIHFQTFCLRLPHNDVRSRVLLVHCLLHLSPRWRITMHNACKQPINAVRIDIEASFISRDHEWPFFLYPSDRLWAVFFWETALVTFIFQDITHFRFTIQNELGDVVNSGSFCLAR